MRKNPGRKERRKNIRIESYKSLQPFASAVAKGRTLNPKEVVTASEWRESRIKELLSVHRLNLTSKERNEARRLVGRWDFWQHKKGD
jgi:hypothetical protein